RSGSFALASAGAGDVVDLDELWSYEGLDQHARLIRGSWPVAARNPVEAVLSSGAADALGLQIGSRVSLASRLDPGVSVDVVVVGVWQPNGSDPYFRGNPLELQGVQTVGRFTTRGPFVVAPADLTGRGIASSLDLEWRGILDVQELGLDQIEPLRASVASLGDRLARELPATRDVAVTTKLPAILADAGRAATVTRSGVALLTIQFAVLAGYAIVLVAGMLLERRRAQTALLRSRGAGSGHLIVMAFVESLLLAATASVVAPFLAVAVVRVLGSVGPLGDLGFVRDVTVTPTAALAAALAGLGCAVGLTLPTLTAAASPSGVRASLGRGAGRTLGQRLGIDVALLGVAALGLWQLRLYGAPLTRNARGAIGVDPLLVAAPGIGLLAGALFAVRIIPRIAEVAERLLERRPGLVASIGGRQVSRRPLRYTRSALLLMLAAALGTFGAAHAATWTRSQGDQAAYRAAADVRVVTADYPVLEGWAVGPAYRSIPGVRTAMPVIRQTIDVGNAIRSAQLVAVDAATTARIVAFPPAETALGLPAAVAHLADARPAPSGLPLPDGIARLAATLDVNLVASPGTPAIPTAYAGVVVSVIVEDGDGRFHTVGGGSARLSGTAQRIEVPLFQTAGGATIKAGGPLWLRAIQIRIEPPPDASVGGTVDLAGMAWSAATTGATWTAIGIPAAGGWGWRRIDPTEPVSFSPPAGKPFRIQVGDEDARQPPATAFDPPTFSYQVGAAEDIAVPAIAGRRFLELAGATVGDTIAASVGGRSQRIRIIGVTDSFPPLDPTLPFVVVDDPTLEATRFETPQAAGAAREWWLEVDPGRGTAVVAAAAGPPFSVTSVIGRDTLTASLSTDPGTLGLIGVIGLGSVAAIVFAAVGFVVSAGVSAGERVGEFALLRALGLSGRELSIWLSLENVFLLGIGLLAGLGLGLLLAWLVLPFVGLTSTGAAAVPPPVVVIPWAALVLPYAVELALLVPTVLVVRRQLARVRISSVLRSAD
ncbi:MAG TPA: FtsX-like permease family protein, partial [Candidatus Limnocylindrales bacterium]